MYLIDRSRSEARIFPHHCCLRRAGSGRASRWRGGEEGAGGGETAASRAKEKRSLPSFRFSDWVRVFFHAASFGRFARDARLERVEGVGRARDVPRRGTRCCRTWASCSGVERAEANVERRRSVSSSHERWSRVVRIAAAPRVHAPVSLAPAAKRQVDAPDTPTISRDGARPQRAL